MVVLDGQAGVVDEGDMGVGGAVCDLDGGGPGVAVLGEIGTGAVCNIGGGLADGGTNSGQVSDDVVGVGVDLSHLGAPPEPA